MSRTVVNRGCEKKVAKGEENGFSLIFRVRMIVATAPCADGEQTESGSALPQHYTSLHAVVQIFIICFSLFFLFEASAHEKVLH